MTLEPVTDDGPGYPDLGPSVAKHRRAAVDGLTELTPTARRAYGDAVEKAIRAKQRNELQRSYAMRPAQCASGTSHNTGEAIHEAMRHKQRAALLAAPAQERRARTPEQWLQKYNDAMGRRD